MISDIIIWKGDKVIHNWLKTASYKNLKPVSQISAICFNDEDEILLLKEPGKDYWMLPGGTPEHGESFEETLIREIKEEASCDIGIVSLIGAIKVHYPHNSNKEEGEDFYQLRFVAKIKKVNELEIDPDRGIKHERIFVPIDEINKYVTWKNIGKEILKETKQMIKH